MGLLWDEIGRSRKDQRFYPAAASCAVENTKKASAEPFVNEKKCRRRPSSDECSLKESLFQRIP